ncbi:hypothetical protein [Bradyrhizobium macuxiense]|nr:hypothetical protein [Bradyrhizobium macuxiense]
MVQSARQKSYWVSSRLQNCLMERTDRLRESELRSAIAEGEAMLANEEYQRLLAGLKPACAAATSAEIKQQLGMLLLAFPGRDDLSAFVEIAVAEIATEPVSRLRLVTAFRNLRRFARFRPSISEILEALVDVDLGHVNSLLKLPDRVKAVRMRLANGDFVQPATARITYSGDEAPDGL